MSKKLTRCPKCGSVDLDLAEDWKVTQTWTQSKKGISGDFEESMNGRIDDTVTAVCLNPDCGHQWEYEGSVEV